MIVPKYTKDKKDINSLARYVIVMNIATIIYRIKF